MKATPTDLPGVLVIEHEVFNDHRGFVFELYASHRFADLGLDLAFTQDNLSHSGAGVLRGLHYQLGTGQAKLIHVVRGHIVDVAVDIRPGSPTYGRSTRIVLSAHQRRSLIIPPYCAHGFYVVEEADMIYKCTDRYRPDLERGIIWNDPSLGIEWPSDSPMLSSRDARLPPLGEISADDLPRYGAGSDGS